MMSTMCAAVFLFATLTIVTAIPLDNRVTSRHQGCCLPPLWQADVHVTQGLNVGGKGIAQYLNGHMWFDRQNKTTAFDGITIMNGKRIDLKYVQLGKKQYNIDKDARTCQVMTQAFPYFDGCPPEGARFIGQETLGKDFLVNTWNADLKGDTYNVNSEETITSDCIPVTVTSIGEVKADWGATGLTSSLRFSEVQWGIKDLSVFDIPDYCKK